MTTTYAAYDASGVYGLGDTPSDAVANARYDTGREDAMFDTAIVSQALAEWIEQFGWDAMSQTFEVAKGHLIRTTGLTDAEVDAALAAI